MFIKAAFPLALLALASTAANSETFSFTDSHVLFEGDNLVAQSGQAIYPVVTGESSYSLRRKHPTLTRCYDDEGRSIGCEMLFSVGYADRVEVTITDGAVSRIDVLDIQL